MAQRVGEVVVGDADGVCIVGSRLQRQRSCPYPGCRQSLIGVKRGHQALDVRVGGTEVHRRPGRGNGIGVVRHYVVGCGAIGRHADETSQSITVGKVVARAAQNDRTG